MSMAAAAVFDHCEATIGDCLARCLNPFNWLRIGGPKRTPPGQMQKKVERGQAPDDIDSFHPPHDYPGAKPHVHFKDKTSLNNDGTIHDKHRGTPNPPKKTRDWLRKHGWGGLI